MKSLMFLIISAVSLMAMNGNELAIKVDEVTEGFIDSKSISSMELINANNVHSNRKMKMSRLEGSEGDRSMIVFEAPSDIKGTALLTYEHFDKDDDQWIYLPALKRIKRIASKNKSGSFMGSEFSYEDLSSQKRFKYSYDDEVKEKDGMYISSRVPKDKHSGYSKQVVYVDAKTFLVQKVEYYDRKKELLKRALFKEYKRIKGIWRFGSIEMKNLQTKKSTIIVTSNETLKNGLKKKDFTKRYLKQQ